MSVFYCAALILCWTPLCVAQQDPHGHQMIHDPTATGAHIPHHRAPCFVHDMYASLREGLGSDGELANGGLPLFGICASSAPLSRSHLVELAQETNRSLAYLTEVAVVSEEDQSGLIKLTYDLPRSPWPELRPVLLLVLESPTKGGNLDVTFTSQWLQPDTQSFCFSEETQYILLPGKASQTNTDQKWTLSAETRSRFMQQGLKDILVGEKTDARPRVTSLLFYLWEGGTNTRNTDVSDSSPGSSHTVFLCELKRLLGDLLPQSQPESPPLQLESFKSSPSVEIGLSSSQTLLADLISSTTFTVFSFTGWRATFPKVHHGELSLSPALLEMLGQRLQQMEAQIQKVLREEDLGDGATGRLRRLMDLSALSHIPVSGKRQYRAFLLLKALQTVARTYEQQRALRATRADHNSSVTINSCGIRDLVVNFPEQFLTLNPVNIKDCDGICQPPSININNHGYILHASQGNANVRALCCVPVAYEDLDVVKFEGQGTYLYTEENLMAKKCECH